MKGLDGECRVVDVGPQTYPDPDPDPLSKIAMPGHQTGARRPPAPQQDDTFSSIHSPSSIPLVASTSLIPLAPVDPIRNGNHPWSRPSRVFGPRARIETGM